MLCYFSRLQNLRLKVLENALYWKLKAYYDSQDPTTESDNSSLDEEQEHYMDVVDEIVDGEEIDGESWTRVDTGVQLLRINKGSFILCGIRPEESIP